MSENTEAGGLVERLNELVAAKGIWGPEEKLMAEAAAALEAQSAELSSLRMIADSKVVSHRDFNTIRAERSEASLASERAAHAETRARMEHERVSFQRMLETTANSRAYAEARLAEALKALEPFAAVAEHDIGDDETDDDIFWPISNARYSMSGRLRVGHLRAARRVREGGKVDG